MWGVVEPSETVENSKIEYFEQLWARPGGAEPGTLQLKTQVSDLMRLLQLAEVEYKL